MELKSKVQTEDVGTRCRIRVHIHARTKSVEGKTVHFRVITAVVSRISWNHPSLVIRKNRNQDRKAKSILCFVTKNEN